MSDQINDCPAPLKSPCRRACIRMQRSQLNRNPSALTFAIGRPGVLRLSPLQCSRAPLQCDVPCLAGEHLVSAGDGGEMLLWKVDMGQLAGDDTHWGRTVLRCAHCVHIFLTNASAPGCRCKQTCSKYNNPLTQPSSCSTMRGATWCAGLTCI